MEHNNPCRLVAHFFVIVIWMWHKCGKWMRPGLFEVKSTFGIRNTYCPPISADTTGRFWHWIACFGKTHHVYNAWINLRFVFSSSTQGYHRHSLLNITSQTFLRTLTMPSMFACLSCINVSEVHTSNSMCETKLNPLYFHPSLEWYVGLLYYNIHPFFYEFVKMHE